MKDAYVSTKNPLPERLRDARTKAALSQRTLGIRIGFDPASASSRMNHYEKGRHIPDIDTLRRMAEELKVPLNYFFCDDKSMAELVVLISQMSEDERAKLIETLTLKARADKEDL